MNGWICGRDGRMDAWMHGWMHGCMDAWMHGCMDGWMEPALFKYGILSNENIHHHFLFPLRKIVP